VLRDSGNLDDVKKFSAKIAYNDLPGIKKMVEDLNGDVACIFIETAFEKPKPEFFPELRKFCTEKGIVLIFDEMWTGFRFGKGSFQEFIGVTPDLSVSSKGVANGFTISILAGRKDIMSHFERLWGYSTFGSDALSIRAALACLQVIEKTDAIATIWKKGEWLQAELTKLISKYNLGSKISIAGYPCRFKFNYASAADEARANEVFKPICIAGGILWNNMFVISAAHEQNHLEKTRDVFDKAFSKFS
jgi:glutamate-1-semialdehyde aminotransferase